VAQALAQARQAVEVAGVHAEGGQRLRGGRTDASEDAAPAVQSDGPGQVDEVGGRGGDALDAGEVDKRSAGAGDDDAL